MPVDELFFPAWPSRIHRQKWNQFVRMLARIGCNVRVRHPQPRQLGLAAEDDGFVTLRRGGTVLRPSYGEIHLCSPCPACLVSEMFSEVLRVFKKMRMDFDEHGRWPPRVSEFVLWPEYVL